MHDENAKDTSEATAAAIVEAQANESSGLPKELEEAYVPATFLAFQQDLADEPRLRAEALARATAAKEAMKAAEAAMVEAMSDAMEYFASYEEIGRAVGMTKQAAHSRVHKFLGEDSGYIRTAAENVPVGAKIAKRSGGKLRTLVADKRVGRAKVTFYDAKDNAFLEVPIGTVTSYTPPVDGMPLGRA